MEQNRFLLCVSKELMEHTLKKMYILFEIVIFEKIYERWHNQTI